MKETGGVFDRYRLQSHLRFMVRMFSNPVLMNCSGVRHMLNGFTLAKKK